MDINFTKVAFGLCFLLAFPACASAESVKPCQGKGQWFPATGKKLKSALAKYIAEKPDNAITGRPIAMIAPHAGYRFSGAAAGAGFASLKGHHYERVVVLGFSHRRFVKGASILDVEGYETPLGRIPVDTSVTRKLLAKPFFQTQAPAHNREHSLENELPFLDYVLDPGWKLVPILIGMPEGEQGAISKKSLAMYSKIADAIRPFIDDDTLVVASSDWTHYGANFGYFPFGRKTFSKSELKPKLKAFDFSIIDPVLKGDLDAFVKRANETKTTVCGRRPICVLLELLPEETSGEVARYYTSGDVTGDWRSIVSYASIVFTAPDGKNAEAVEEGGVSAATQKRLLSIARKTLETVLRGKPKPKFKAETAELKLKRGVFVTLTKGGKLRGCIGCFKSDEPLYEIVSKYAVISATRDRRFSRVKASELKDIKIEISVLSPMRPVKNPLKEVVLGKHGIYIKRGWRSGTYLPQVATEHDMSLEQFLSSCCAHKAGLPADAWKDDATTVYVYTAQVFHEQ